MKRRRAALVCGAAALGVVAAIAPIALRNAVAVQAFVPVRLGAGTLLWEGIGETERGAEFGAVASDSGVVEQERVALGFAPEAPLGLFWPDGVGRDRERARKAMAVIRSHPIWFAGVMARRMGGMFDYEGYYTHLYGPLGFNVRVALPAVQHNGLLVLLVRFLSMLQSILLPLWLMLSCIGVVLAARREWRTAVLLLSTVLYYLVMNSIMHMEQRYNLPMQALLLVFAGFTLHCLSELPGELLLKYRAKRLSASELKQEAQGS
jgi:hypothetical protein